MYTCEAASVILALAAVAANLPFQFGRELVSGSWRGSQELGARLHDWTLLGCVAWRLGLTLEENIDPVQPRGRAFPVALACFYLTLAFPGAVWRCLRQHAR